MNTATKKNVEEIVDQFDMYLRRGVYNDWKMNDRFLRFILDRSQTPSYQGRKTVEICPYTGKQRTVEAEMKLEHLTPEQEKELREVNTLMNGSSFTNHYSAKYDGDGYVDHAKWTTSSELYQRITKLPPDLQPSILVVAIVIYLLRELDADFDSDTATFGEFYENYFHVVLASHDVL